MREIRVDAITIPVQDGTTMGAYLARPETAGRHPGLLVLQEAFGVNEHIRGLVRRFAYQGFVALAPELYHRAAPGFEGLYDDVGTAAAHMKAMTPRGLELDLEAACAWLMNEAPVLPGEVSCVGFCMGGRSAFVAASLLPLRAAVSFYGGGIAPGLLDRVPRIRAPMLFFWGGLDKHIPPEQIAATTQALRSAGKAFVNVEFSRADHGFFCDARPSYDPGAARQSWAHALEFLKICSGRDA